MKVTSSWSKAVGEGHYAKKQVFSRSWLIRWSHRSRLRVGLELAKPFSAGTVLDYGCGDGTFLSLLQTSPFKAGRAVGAEIATSIVEDCRRRFEGELGLKFLLTADLAAQEHEAAYDAVFCMEVLEHLLEYNEVFGDFERYLKPGGTLIISVPVETGLPLAVKQVARRLAAWRRLGDYAWSGRYTAREFWASLWAGSEPHLARQPIPLPDGSYALDHKGFNWMVLRQRLSQRFEIQRTLGSPLAWLPPQLGSQAWFVACKKRPAAVHHTPSLG